MRLRGGWWLEFRSRFHCSGHRSWYVAVLGAQVGNICTQLLC